MISHFVRRTTTAVLLSVLVASLGCSCCPRKGLVLRGDWSLELNRVPHMRSNGPTYDADCCAPAGCSCTSCTSCTSCGYADGQYLSYTDAGGYGIDRRPRMFGFGPGMFGHGQYAEEFGGESAGHAGGSLQDPTPPAFSRFHPVPVRPVFEPQAFAYAPAVESPPVPHVEQLPPPATSQRRSTGSPIRQMSAIGDAESMPDVAEVVNAGGEESVVGADAYVEDAAEETSPDVAPANSHRNSVAWKTARRRA